MCASLRDLISARSVAVFDAVPGESPRLIHAPEPGRPGSTGGIPGTETLAELVRELKADPSAAAFIDADEPVPAPYSVIPLCDDEAEVLGLLIVSKRCITYPDWSVIAEYASGLSRCLLDEAESRRRERELRDGRLALVREIHDTVLGDLFGVALALDDQSSDEVQECAARVRAVQRHLRSILEGDLPRSESLTIPGLEAMLRSEARDVPLELELEVLATVPDRVATVAARCAGEGLRNALRHAEPTSVSVLASVEADVVRVCVSNDGVRPRDGRPGIGLRLLELDALSLGGSISATHEEGTWQLMLTMPAKDSIQI
jgi:signal transduction histidine kinase